MVYYYFFSMLGSKRFHAKARTKRPMNAVATARGFFRCAEIGTLYAICDIGMRTDTQVTMRDTYIDRSGVPVSELQVLQINGRSADGVKVSRVSQESLLCRVERRNVFDLSESWL